MNAHRQLASVRILIVLFCAALMPRPAGAAPAAAAKPDPLLPLTDRPFVTSGMLRENVRQMLGEPSATLTSNVWIYLDFKASSTFAASLKVPNPAAYNALLVVFTHDRVSRLRLMPGDAARALIARQKAAAEARRPIAAK